MVGSLARQALGPTRQEGQDTSRPLRTGPDASKSPPGPLTSQDLLNGLAVFEPPGEVHLRSARRPAGRHLLVEIESDPEEGNPFCGLADFWLAALWRFLEDTHQNHLAFEGLAFQALAEGLSLGHFERLYADLRAHLILAPLRGVELRQAYRLLQGRLLSFAGVTHQGTFWSGFFQANYLDLDE